MKKFNYKIQIILSSIFKVDFHDVLLGKFNERNREYEHKIFSEETAYASEKEIDDYIKKYNDDLEFMVALQKDFIWWFTFNAIQASLMILAILGMSFFIVYKYIGINNIFSHFLIWVTMCILPFYILGNSNYQTSEYFKKKLFEHE